MIVCRRVLFVRSKPLTNGGVLFFFSWDSLDILRRKYPQEIKQKNPEKKNKSRHRVGRG